MRGLTQPARGHHIVEGLGTGARPWQTSPAPEETSQLRVGNVRVGNEPASHQLPNQNPERPNVGFGIEETAVDERLDGHPLDGKSSLSALKEPIFVVEIPGEAEVGDFDDAVRGEHTISGGQVAVDE